MLFITAHGLFRACASGPTFDVSNESRPFLSREDQRCPPLDVLSVPNGHRPAGQLPSLDAFAISTEAALSVFNDHDGEAFRSGGGATLCSTSGVDNPIRACSSWRQPSGAERVPALGGFLPANPQVTVGTVDGAPRSSPNTAVRRPTLVSASQANQIHGASQRLLP